MFIVRRALISVSDKRNLIPFARGLIDLGAEILSTGGTCRQLKEAGINAVEVSTRTGFPEIMGGRVKTLHPVIHGGLLGRRGIDDDVMAEHGISIVAGSCANNRADKIREVSDSDRAKQQ